MAKRGRKPQFRPIPPASQGASYRLYVPGRGVISLETNDEKEAWTKAGQYSQSYAAGAAYTPPSVSSDNANSGTVNAAPFVPPQPQTTAKEMLAAWTQQSPMQSEQLPLSLPDSPTQSQSSAAPSLSGSYALSPSTSEGATVAQKVDAAMPPEKRAKIASMLARGITLLNVAGTAWCVKLLGTKPNLDDEDEAKDVLKIGWELQLEEMFVNHPPQPWMVIAGGTAALGVGMLLNGERIKKEDKNKLRPPEKVGESLTNESDAA